MVGLEDLSIFEKPKRHIACDRAATSKLDRNLHSIF